MHNPTDSHVVDNDDSTFASITKSGVELKEGFYSNNMYEQETVKNSYYYYYNQNPPRQSDDIVNHHIMSPHSSVSKIHLVSPSHH